MLWWVWPCPRPRGVSGWRGSAWPGKRSSCAGDARNKVPLPVPQPVICIQMRRKSCQPRPEGEGDLGCRRRGEVAQCVPPKPPSSLGRLGAPQRGWLSLQPGMQDAPPSAAPSCPVCLSILPFLPLLLFFLFHSSSACSPVCPCSSLMVKI